MTKIELGISVIYVAAYTYIGLAIYHCTARYDSTTRFKRWYFLGPGGPIIMGGILGTLIIIELIIGLA